MNKFMHIESFKQISKHGREVCAKTGQPIKYKGTVKLHGTNSAVVFKGSELIAQSKNRELSITDDNAGFAAFVEDKKFDFWDAYWQIHEHYSDIIAIDNEVITLFGEWIGPGIQDSVAICKLPVRQFVAFAICIGEGEEKRYLDFDFDLVNMEDANIFSINRIPSWEIEVDFSSVESVQSALDKTYDLTESVDANCPWAASFDIIGPGEGIVWTPQGENSGDTELVFKTKGNTHKQKLDKPPRVKVGEVIPEVDQFIDNHLTGDRLQQGLDWLEEMGRPFSLNSTGDFIKFVVGEIERETSEEVKEIGHPWNVFSRKICASVAMWYKEQVAKS